MIEVKVLEQRAMDNVQIVYMEAGSDITPAVELGIKAGIISGIRMTLDALNQGEL